MLRNNKTFYPLILTAFLGMFIFVTYYAIQQSQVYQSSARSCPIGQHLNAKGVCTKNVGVGSNPSPNPSITSTAGAQGSCSLPFPNQPTYNEQTFWNTFGHDYFLVGGKQGLVAGKNKWPPKDVSTAFEAYWRALHGGASQADVDKLWTQVVSLANKHNIPVYNNWNALDKAIGYNYQQAIKNAMFVWGGGCKTTPTPKSAPTVIKTTSAPFYQPGPYQR